ncbi:DNA cytosine methyltransferase [Streptomyces sp. A0642]|uniref:DNA cytosine methyltransferase n=1 Tax=Streptomyces sp. A0642 TaxID=2563100 RepID=UPI0010A29894|nr:DNA cytosine methyltransferase [Streptomyces sp. A0642]THA65394.1 DNA cytosine methyltransferase [Streptomyces sp. A0642]
MGDTRTFGVPAGGMLSLLRPAPGISAELAADAAEQEAEDAAALTAAAGHPALTECQSAAALLTEYADLNPSEEADEWAYCAAERITECAYAVVEGHDERAGELAHEARGERAAIALGRFEDRGAVTAERIAALDDETRELLNWYARPFPIEWLFAPERDTFGRILRKRVIVLFHGPGGLSLGLRDILGADVDIIGIDLDGGAVATATAAGFRVVHADVTALDPENPALQYVSIIALTPPCQAFTPSGLGKGRYTASIDVILNVILEAGAAAGFAPWEHSPTGYAPRSGDTWDEVRAPLAQLEDPRAGLMAEVIIWPLGMLARPGGILECVMVEQSSALPRQIEDALFEQLTQAGWHTTEAWTLDAVTYGGSHRKRRFMTAHRGAEKPFVDLTPAEPIPAPTFAEVVGWSTGRVYLTRGHRPVDPATGRAKGGGSRSADLPSTCVTATAYGWADSETGETITQSDIGRLVGFPGDYPWTHVGRGRGVRNVAQQAADAVCPMVAAAVFGRILGDENWEAKTRAYVRELYGINTGATITELEQLDLFTEEPGPTPAAA